MPDGLSPEFAEFLDTFSMRKSSTDHESKEGATRDAKEPTHFSLAGGKYFIPMEHNQRFLHLYAEEWRRFPENRLFFIERKTPVFRMHFDLDMVQPVAPTDAEMLSLARLFCSAMKLQYSVSDIDPRTFVCIVLKAPSMPKKGWPGEDGSEPPLVEKTGYHMIWPFLYVTQEQALQLREVCVVKANQMGPRLPPCNPYSDMIDTTVLLENGLRMVGSDKVKTCGACKGKGKPHAPAEGRGRGELKEQCHWCAGSGRLAENRVYKPDFVLGPDNNLDEKRLQGITGVQNRLPCARFCSIRSSSTPTPTFKPLSNIPCPTLTKLRTSGKRRLPASAESAASVGESGESTTVSGSGNEREVSPSTALFKLAQEFLRIGMGGEQWAAVELWKLTFLFSHNQYRAKVRGEGASFCTNVRRCHTSSTVYFIFKSDGVVQRCYCKKEGTADTPCSKFTGPLARYGSRFATLKNALFQTQTEAAASAGPSTVEELLAHLPPEQRARVMQDKGKRALLEQQLKISKAFDKRACVDVGHMSAEEAAARRQADASLRVAAGLSPSQPPAAAASEDVAKVHTLASLDPMELRSLDAKLHQQAKDEVSVLRSGAFGTGALPLGVDVKKTPKKRAKK